MSNRSFIERSSIFSRDRVDGSVFSPEEFKKLSKDQQCKTYQMIAECAKEDYQQAIKENNLDKAQPLLLDYLVLCR